MRSCNAWSARSLSLSLSPPSFPSISSLYICVCVCVFCSPRFPDEISWFIVRATESPEKSVRICITLRCADRYRNTIFGTATLHLRGSVRRTQTRRRREIIYLRARCDIHIVDPDERHQTWKIASGGRECFIERFVPSPSNKLLLILKCFFNPARRNCCFKSYPAFRIGWTMIDADEEKKYLKYNKKKNLNGRFLLEQ